MLSLALPTGLLTGLTGSVNYSSPPVSQVFRYFWIHVSCFDCLSRMGKALIEQQNCFTVDKVNVTLFIFPLQKSVCSADTPLGRLIYIIGVYNNRPDNIKYIQRKSL